jgi:phosphoribosylanthranilate isomerase
MQRSFPRLKYCGFTRSQDIRDAIACGVDAIGLNFYTQSPRYVGARWSHDLVSSYCEEVKAGRLLAVGVFVNETHARVEETVNRFALNAVQLHGDESPEWLEESRSYAALTNVQFLKAISWRGTAEDERNALAWKACHDPRWLGLLVDSYDPVQRGGTGKTVRWELLHPRPIALQGNKLLLAGGLKPENVLQALQVAFPDGLDIASGIELSPGIKDPLAMKMIAKTFRDWTCEQIDA